MTMTLTEPMPRELDLEARRLVENFNDGNLLTAAEAHDLMVDISDAITAGAQRARAEALEEAARRCNAVDVTLSAAGMAIEIRERIRALAAIRNPPMTDKPVYGQWQPIETAPKDGTEILVFRTDPMVQAIGVDKINKYEQWTYSDNRHPPTHWMPLPDPPYPDTAETPEE